jgi:hypothetical protein
MVRPTDKNSLRRTGTECLVAGAAAGVQPAEWLVLTGLGDLEAS